MHIKNLYKEKLKNLMDDYAHFVYKVTRSFPKEELFGVTSQFRRSSISIKLLRDFLWIITGIKISSRFFL